MPKGGLRTPAGGRPAGSTIPTNLRRVNLNSFRLPQWIVDWLKSHPRQGSKMIEEAVVEYWKIKKPGKEIDR